MKKIKTIAVISIVTMLSQIGLTLVAQAIPDGTYTQTCRNISEDGNTLYATCKNVEQRWRRTSLQGFDRCATDIKNRNGSLRCGVTDIPGGNYKQSCSNIQVRGFNLQATCSTSSGDRISTYLKNYPSCYSNSIRNREGSLSCDRR